MLGSLTAPIQLGGLRHSLASVYDERQFRELGASA